MDTSLLPEDTSKVDILFETLFNKYRPRECFLFLVKSALDHYEKIQKEAYRERIHL
jgi:hypothetical protein